MMVHVTPRRPLRIAAAALLAGALAAGAHPALAGAKAKIELAPGCYLSKDRGKLTGSGFKPNATWTAKLGGDREIGSGRTDDRGRLRANFTAPRYDGMSGTREIRLSVTDGPNVASTIFLMSPLVASFSPEAGDPARMRVRWRVLGIGPHRGVYVHYLGPNDRLRRTVRIGTSDDVCGALKTGPIALFPFKGFPRRADFGTWTFQVDTTRKFSPRTKPRLMIDFFVRRPAARRRAPRRRGSAD